jgi:hypothetical protein
MSERGSSVGCKGGALSHLWTTGVSGGTNSSAARQYRVATELACTGEKRVGFYRRSCVQRRFRPALVVYRSHDMGKGQWSRGGRRRPMAASMCGCRRVRMHRVAPAYGQARVIPLKHTIPTAPGLGPTVTEGPRRACACVRRRRPTRRDSVQRRAWVRSGSRAIPSAPV